MCSIAFIWCVCVRLCECMCVCVFFLSLLFFVRCLSAVLANKRTHTCNEAELIQNNRF